MSVYFLLSYSPLDFATGQSLPNELTLAQLLTLLHERGLPTGQNMLELVMKLQPKSSKDDRKLFFKSKQNQSFLYRAFVVKLVLTPVSSPL